MCEEIVLVEVILPTIGKPNINGRVYTIETANQIISEIEKGNKYVQMGAPDSGYLELDRVVAVMESPRIINDQLVVNIRPLQKMPLTDVYLELVRSGSISYRTAGRAHLAIETAGLNPPVVTNYHYVCTYTCPKHED